MTTYLFDGNTFTEFEDQTKPHFEKVTYRLSQLSDTDNVCISVISAYEYQYGISKAPESIKQNLLMAWQTFVDSFTIMQMSLHGAELFGQIKFNYKQHTGSREKTLLKHTADFILASMALEHAAVLVSADSIFSKIKEFQSDLKIENWLQ